MTEFELLQKLKQESQQNTPDLFDKIMSSAQHQGIIKSKNSKNGASRIAKGSTMKSKLILGIATFAVGLSVIIGAAAIGLNTDSNNQKSPVDSGISSETPGDDSPSDSGSSTTHTCEFVFDSTVDPKCEEQGYDLYTCTCGKSEKRDFKPATGHKYSGFTILGSAHTEIECGDYAVRKYKCNTCGEEELVEGILEHEFEFDMVCKYCRAYKNPQIGDDGYWNIHPMGHLDVYNSANYDHPDIFQFSSVWIHIDSRVDDRLTFRIELFTGNGAVSFDLDYTQSYDSNEGRKSVVFEGVFGGYNFNFTVSYIIPEGKDYVQFFVKGISENNTDESGESFNLQCQSDAIKILLDTI